VGEIGVPLSLEGGDVRPKSSDEPSVRDRDFIRGQERSGRSARREGFRFFEAPAAWSVECEFHKELVDVIDDRMPARLPSEPVADLTVQRGKLPQFVVRIQATPVETCAEGGERAGTSIARLAKQHSNRAR